MSDEWCVMSQSDPLVNITHYSSLITHYSLLITHYSLLITHHSLLITHHFNFARSLSFTIFGFALPFEAFITCPTKNPNKVSLPDRYCSSCGAFAAITSSMTRS